MSREKPDTISTERPRGPRSRRDRALWLRRAVVLAVAAGLALALGARPTPTRATPWVKSDFKGPARAALTIREGPSHAGTGDHTGDPSVVSRLEVFAAMTYGTEVSSFDRGILLKTTFPRPRAGDHATLLIDLERRGSRTRWSGEDPRQLRARYYVAGGDGVVTTDATVVAGELDLEAIVIARGAIGFRIRGWLELIDPGTDGRLDSDDDRVIDAEIAFETVPPPEAVATGRPEPSPLPPPNVCAWPDCYEDPDYFYDPYDAYYGPACGDVAVGYSHYDYDDTAGCDGDPYVEGGYDELEEPGWDDEVSGGCDGETPSYEDDGAGGCEGESSDSSSGCGGESESGCGGESSGSGCGGEESSGGGCGGGNGCEGDTFDGGSARAGGIDVRQSGAGGWLAILALLGLVLAAHQRRG